MKIGVFDSGSGGLTVMRALDAALPTHDFVYFGDHAHAPYGDKTPDEIYAHTLHGIAQLFALGCGLVILACNTAAARGLRRLQQEWLPQQHPQHRVLGVIVPVVEEITGQPWQANAAPLPRSHIETRVAVFATKHTVESGAFDMEIHHRAPHVQVWQQACPRLVRLIEDDAPEAELRSAVQTYVAALLAAMAPAMPETCILGCTHYPLIAHLFRQALPAGVRLLSQPDVTANSLKHYLARHAELSFSTEGTRAFYTSGNNALATRIATRFYGKPVHFMPIA